MRYRLNDTSRLLVESTDFDSPVSRCFGTHSRKVLNPSFGFGANVAVFLLCSKDHSDRFPLSLSSLVAVSGRESVLDSAEGVLVRIPISHILLHLREFQHCCVNVFADYFIVLGLIPDEAFFVLGHPVDFNHCRHAGRKSNCFLSGERIIGFSVWGDHCL